MHNADLSGRRGMAGPAFKPVIERIQTGGHGCCPPPAIRGSTWPRRVACGPGGVYGGLVKQG